MAIKSLNEAYEKDELVYLCNASGEVTDPDNTERVLMTDDEINSVLTLREQNLYRNYWTDGDDWCNRYVMRVGDRPALGICYRFTQDWCRNIVKVLSGSDTPDMLRLFLALSDAARMAFEPLVPGCDLYIGDGTDPEGHELLVVVPYEMRDKADGIVEALDAVVYNAVEQIF